MIELYKIINDRTINKTVKKIIKRSRKDDWKYFRIGVEMRGGDFTMAKDVIVRELEFMNTKPYEELLTYHPKKFMKALAGTRWSKTALECYPGASYEYMYIGKYLSSYKDENGLLDMELVDRDYELIQRDISSVNLTVCKKEMKEKENIVPSLVNAKELLEFFPHAKEVYVCDYSKTIAVFFEFKVMFHEPKGARMRLDSWRYDPKYYIKDTKVLNNQLEKAQKLSEQLNIPGIDDPAGFNYWTNTDVTKEEIQSILFIYNSVGCGSMQYYKECKRNILESKFGEKYKDYTIRNATTVFDPFTGNRETRARGHSTVSDDFSNNQAYKELYEITNL